MLLWASTIPALGIRTDEFFIKPTNSQKLRGIRKYADSNGKDPKLLDPLTTLLKV